MLHIGPIRGIIRQYNFNPGPIDIKGLTKVHGPFLIIVRRMKNIVRNWPPNLDTQSLFVEVSGVYRKHSGPILFGA